MAPEPGHSSDRVPSQTRVIDLTREAAIGYRYQRRTFLMGTAIGSAFVAIGVVEFFVLSTGGTVGGNLLIAAFLAVLGGSIIWFTYRGGLRDPVARITLGEDSATFLRRSGSSVRLPWLDPRWDFEIEDPAPDPNLRAEAKQHLFFTGVGAVYGTLTRSDVGPILDAAREHGLLVTVREVTTRKRGTHVVRRIRIRPYR